MHFSPLRRRPLPAGAALLYPLSTGIFNKKIHIPVVNPALC